MATSKLKEFLDSLDNSSVESNYSEVYQGGYEDGYAAGYQQGELEGKHQGQLEMYQLVKSLNTEQLKTLREFVRFAFKIGKENNNGN